jgi:ribosome-associated protein
MENEEEFEDLEEIDVVSRSQLKRESLEIKKLGIRLTELSTTKLATIPLDEPVLEAIALAHKIQNKRSALKRHYQFIGKLLRTRDLGEILSAVDRLDRADHLSIQKHHQAEMWRDNILASGNAAIDQFMEQFDSGDRQKLRQLSRNYDTAKTDSKKTQQAREIYKTVKYAIDQL